MATTRQTDHGKRKVARIAFALAADRDGCKPSVCGADGTRLRVGDAWLEDDVGDMGMRVTFGTSEGGLQVRLAIRIDALDRDGWAAFEAAPTVIAVLPVPPVVAFAVEIDGGHARAAYPIGADPAETRRVRERLLGTAKMTLTVLGVGQGRIRCIKRGHHLQRIFDMLAEGFVTTPSNPDDDAFASAFADLELPPAVLFAAAMRAHLLPIEDP